MPTFKITLSYDGTDYVGWQRQPSGTSIQGLVEEALRELDNRDVAVAGAGRTDAGVHAIGQVASFTLERDIDAATAMRALNAKLPPAVRVTAASEAPAGFHARFDARAKSYRYRIWNGEFVSPFERRYTWHIVGGLDAAAMAAAARLLEGQHDFAAFQGSGSDAQTTVRTIFKSAICQRQSEILYDVVGDGFLRHMVRSIVGSLVEVGRGRRGADWIQELVASKDRTAVGRTAPARGLFLVVVDYDAPLAAES